jgi:hypothetical protein
MMKGQGRTVSRVLRFAVTGALLGGGACTNKRKEERTVNEGPVPEPDNVNEGPKLEPDPKPTPEPMPNVNPGVEQDEAGEASEASEASDPSQVEPKPDEGPPPVRTNVGRENPEPEQ